jgi:hypothetical protein
MLCKIYTPDSNPTPVERVLWLSPDNTVLTLINIESKNLHLQIIEYQQFLNELKNGTRKKILTDPFERLRFPDSHFSTAQLKRRDRAWEIIKDLVTRPDGAIFDSTIRGNLVRDTAEEKNCARKTIYFYLLLFWQRGQMKNALIADYQNCGSNSQSKPEQIKRGRWNSVEIEVGHRLGRPLTPEDEENMELTIRKHHLVRGPEKGGKTMQLSLENTYKTFLAKYYSGLVYKNEEFVEELLSEYPSIDQFRNYYYSNLRDVVNDYIKKMVCLPSI